MLSGVVAARLRSPGPWFEEDAAGLRADLAHLDEGMI